jgi:hypothetical protein
MLDYWKQEETKASSARTHDGGQMVYKALDQALKRGQLHDPQAGARDSAELKKELKQLIDGLFMAAKKVLEGCHRKYYGRNFLDILTRMVRYAHIVKFLKPKAALEIIYGTWWPGRGLLCMEGTWWLGRGVWGVREKCAGGHSLSASYHALA